MKPIFYQLLSGLLVLLLLSSGAQPVAAQGGGTIVGRGGIRHLATSPDGKYIAVASTIGIWLYEAADVTKQPRFISGHTEEVQQVAFSSDGTKLASASLDRTAGLWDVQTAPACSALRALAQAFTPSLSAPTTRWWLLPRPIKTPSVYGRAIAGDPSAFCKGIAVRSSRSPSAPMASRSPPAHPIRACACGTSSGALSCAR